MIIAVLHETNNDERRVAATPNNVAQLLGLGYEVVVEPGAGLRANFDDQAYEDTGARMASLADVDVDIVLCVSAPSDSQLDRIKRGAVLVGLLNPAAAPALLDDFASREITAIAMEGVPRISRAQSLDVLSSMANIAGYRAVVEAAHTFDRSFAGQITAAGKTAPAEVLIVGAGVAGLAAIGAAGSLGAKVRATDPRPEVAEQVRSLGGEYLPVDPEEVEVSATGYAREMSDDYRQREIELYRRECQRADIVVTTALIPGRPAPLIITSEMVAAMKPGSVIVDLAAAAGGNVAGTVAGRAATTDNGVVIVGYTDFPSRMASQASQLYGTNLVNLLKLMTPESTGQLMLDHSDIVQRSVTAVHDGQVLWPPPPVKVSAAEKAAPPAAAPEAQPVAGRHRQRRRPVALLAAGAAVFALMAIAPVALRGHLLVFALAVVIGFYVIGSVHHALHTPLMSVTNAISGIVVVGAILQIGSASIAITVASALAVGLASVNIFGGFTVTRRMLAMFVRST